MTGCVSVSHRCRPPVFGKDEGSLIDDPAVLEELTMRVHVRAQQQEADFIGKNETVARLSLLKHQ